MNRGDQSQDTSPGIASIYHELLMRKAGEERLHMGCDAFETAKSIAASSLSAQPVPDVPGYGPARTLKERLFLRLYGREFSIEEQSRILPRIREAAERVKR